MTKTKRFLPYVIGILLPLAVGGLSSALTMSAMESYGNIAKPPLSPPGIVFPIAWAVLYTLMGIASVLVWRSGSKEKNDGLIYYGFQLVLNFFWPLIFFSAREYSFAFIWLIGLLLAVAVTAAFFKKSSRAAFWLMLPYILWLLFAAYLNAGVMILN